jgi:two-component system copper resistance phosphate regulon response regulator CusR
LEESGFVVDVATTGDDGLYLARTVGYDLVILDVMLPNLYGWDVLTRLRKEGKQIPALFLRYCKKLWIGIYQAAASWGLIPSMN